MLLIALKHAARSLGVSPRRVRALLSQGRIVGYKNDRNIWMVAWPLDVSPGKRGPDLRHFPVRHVFTTPKPRSGARQGTTGSPVRKKPVSSASCASHEVSGVKPFACKGSG